MGLFPSEVCESREHVAKVVDEIEHRGSRISLIKYLHVLVRATHNAIPQRGKSWLNRNARLRLYDYLI